MNLKSLVPMSLTPAARAIYYRLFRAGLRFRCWYADLGDGSSPVDPPLPPAMLRFRVSEELSTDRFLRIGAACADHIRQHAYGMGVDLAQACRVLDFGCGCGRTIRWFLGDSGNAEFHGVDVDAGAIAWCGRHLTRGHFQANGSTPPIPYPAAYFDLVYCVSVFTHLDESAQDQWLAELARVLKPGGVLLLTVHGQTAASILDAEGRNQLRSNGFLHRRSRKLKGLVPDWYQTTWHTREYILNRVSEWLADVHYAVVPDGIQDFVIARRRTDVRLLGTPVSHSRR